LAVSLKQNGVIVSGTDDTIPDNLKSRLKVNELLPADTKWHPDAITPEIEAIVVSVNVKPNNPELQKAHKLGIKIYSYPEFIYELCKDKIRIVISGSFGKTTITSIVIHALKTNDITTDFLIGADTNEQDSTLCLTPNSYSIIIEGDEQLASYIDRRPAFHLYKPHIALITGIAWDHVEIYQSFYEYIEQFRQFIDSIEPNGLLFYCENDIIVKRLVEEHTRADISKIPYTMHPHEIFEGRSFLKIQSGRIPLYLFGDHNLQNIAGAKHICSELGLSNEKFYSSILTFTGIEKRMQLLARNKTSSMFFDYAQSPAKVNATLKALKKQFADNKITACLELYSYTSIDPEFLDQYMGIMQNADEQIIYYNIEYSKKNNLEPLSDQNIKQSFGSNDVLVFTNKNYLLEYLKKKDWRKNNLIMMSISNFDNIDLNIIKKAFISSN
ncbi:MAG: Mur ligase family protein, partial [Bacteroidales bacterium]